MPNGTEAEETTVEADGQPRWIPQTPENLYLGEYVLHKARLADSLSDYLVTLIAKINDMSLTLQCKNELAVLISGAFDKTNVLAKIENPVIPIIDFELALNKAKMGFTIWDINQPELVTTITMIRNAYALFISRAKGGWEAQQQHRLQFHTESHQNITTGPSQQPGMQKKRGFRLPFG
jgi:hypothetical protein